MDRRPDPAEFAEYYGRYIAAVPDGSILASLESQRAEVASLLASIPEEKEGFRYAPGKWSIREVVGHVTDGERVFSCRALAFARGDEGPLPTFDENGYAAESGADVRSLAELAAELDTVRGATLSLFRGFGDEAWSRTGVASGYEFTVRSLAWIICGHAEHHMNILRDRYLAAVA